MKFEADEDAFRASLKQLAKLTGKSMKQVVCDRGAFFARDSAKMLPPFGKTPIKESWEAQRKVGLTSIDRQVKRAFRSIIFLDGIKNPKIAKRLRRLSTKRGLNPLELERVIRDMGFKRVVGVIDSPTEETHNQSRGRDGRVRKKQPQWFVRRDIDVKRFIKKKQLKLGVAKAGWMVVIMKLDALRDGKTTVSDWITRNNSGQGVLQIHSTGDFGIVASNVVPFAQKHATSAWREAIEAQYIGAQKQAYMTLKALERKDRKAQGS